VRCEEGTAARGGDVTRGGVTSRAGGIRGASDGREGPRGEGESAARAMDERVREEEGGPRKEDGAKV